MEIWPQLEEDLMKYREISDLIRLQLFSYVNEINKLISEISNKDFDNTSNQFDKVFSIQSEIATVFYKYNFELPEVLDDFVRNFDRDDEYARKHWYRIFKEGFKLNC